MSSSRKAFTLIELLMVIAIMFLLITLAIVAFGGVRASANRTASLNSVRQMAMGFNSYAADHDGRFMPGYLAESTINLDGDPRDINIVATLPNGSKLKFDTDICNGDICDRSSWVWRLTPYVGESWETFFTDYRSPRLMTRLTAEFESDIYGPPSASGSGFGISDIPSFGMNTVFIGGDSYHGGPAVTDRNPWSPTDPNNVLAATRLSAVINPAKIILFGASMRTPDSPDPSGREYNLNFGSPDLRPPYLDYDNDTGQGVGASQQWAFGTDDADKNLIINAGGSFTNAGGWPIARHGNDLVPIAHLDGSVETIDRYLMGNEFSGSMWSPRVVGRTVVQD